MLETLALSENPFDPDLPNLGRITSDALTVADKPALADLLCLDVARFRESARSVARVLLGAGPGAKQTLQRPALVLVVGVQGSGRTTFAHVAMREAKRYPTRHGPNWQTFTLDLTHLATDLDLRRVTEALDALSAEIRKTFGPGPGNVVVLIENLPRIGQALDQVILLFKQFPALFGVFVVTATDQDLLDRDFDAASVWIERVECPKLTADDVRTFILHRVPGYRDKAVPHFEAEADLKLFPFAETAAARAVGGQGGARPLQSVKRWLIRAIDRQHDDLAATAELVPAQKADPAELRRRLIG